MLRTPRHTLFDYSRTEDRPQKLAPNAFAKLARFAFRNAILVLLAWCIITALMLLFVVQKYSSANQTAFGFNSESKQSLYLNSLVKNFPHLDTLITITLNNKDTEVLKLARDAFVGELENHKDQFELVFAPGTGKFYDNHAMLYHSKEDIEARVAYALSLRPLFTAIAEAPTAESLSTLVREVSAAIKQGRDPQGLDDLFSQSASSLQALMQGTKQPVDWTLIAGLNTDPSPNSVIILALPKPGQNENALALAKQVLKLLGQQTATKANLDQASAQSTENPTSAMSRSRAVQAMALAAILTLLGLASVLGRSNLVAMVFLPITIGLAFSAFTATLIFPVNMIAIWPVFAGVGFSAIITATRATFAAVEAVTENPNAETAIMLAAQKQGSGIIWLAAINIAVWAGFLVLWGHGAAAIAGIAANGTIAGLFASLTLVPAITKLFGPELHWQAQAWVTPAYSALFENRIWRTARTYLSFFVVASAFAGLFAAPHVLNFRQTQSVSNQPVNLVVSNIADAQAALLKLKTIPEASAVRWLGAFLPQDVDAKRTAMAPLKGQFPRIGSLNAQTPDDLRNQISALQESLTEIAGLATTRPSLRAAADEFRRSLEVLGGTSSNTEIIELENRIFSRFNNLADRAEFLSGLDNPNLESLDPRLKSLFLSPDNIYRLEVSPTPGTSNVQLAKILFENSLSAAHPSLVAVLQEQTTAKCFIYIVTAAGILGLIFMSLSIAQIAGIGSAGLTALIILSLCAGGLGLTQQKLQSELLFTVVALVALLFSIIATAFKKTEISEAGAPGAMHAVETWLPMIIAVACVIPIFLLNIEAAKSSATNFLIGGASITATTGFVLRPLTLLFRNTTKRVE